MNTFSDLENEQKKILLTQPCFIGVDHQAVESFISECVAKGLAADAIQQKLLQKYPPANQRNDVDDWYPCLVHIEFGFFYGHMEAGITFKDNVRKVFKANFWGGGLGVFGGTGMSNWSKGYIPSHNKNMEFSVVGASGGLGVINILWWPKGGKVEGGCSFAATGAGGLGGGGTGKWTKA